MSTFFKFKCNVRSPNDFREKEAHIEEKTLSPDVFAVWFYQECWETIEDDVLVEVFFEFYNDEINNQSKNNSFIALVPKKSQTSRISNYEPLVWLSVYIRS